MRAARDARVREGLDTDYELYRVISKKPGSSIYELAKSWWVKRQGIRICPTARKDGGGYGQKKLKRWQIRAKSKIS
jgi:hypothetical protein